MKDMLRRRGLTLLELLIAIALVAAMTAIVAPNLLGRLDERRFDSAVDIVSQTLLLARAHAQTTGETIEVRWIADQRSRSSTGEFTQSHLDATVLQLDSLDASEAGASSDPAIERPEFSSPADPADQSDDGTIYEPWARQPLPDGVRLTSQRPDWLEDSVGSSPALLFDDAEVAGESDDEPSSLRLAVFLPDGSALVADTRWLVDDKQRTMKLTINHWTGLPSLQRVMPAADRSEDDVAADEEARQDSREELTGENSKRAAQPSDSSGDDAQAQPSQSDASDEQDSTADDDESS